MKTNLKKALSLSALGLTLVVFGANQGCDVTIQDQTSDPYWLQKPDRQGAADENSHQKRDATMDAENKDQILISGSGEILNIHAGNLAFMARINWEDGRYFFAADPQGEITGDKIICAATVDQDFFEGSCFRSGRVCSFQYSSSLSQDNQNNAHGTDAYSLDFSTCKQAGQLGPFFVPLESPLCGQDPFPACPSDKDLFPTGPSHEEVKVNEPPVVEPIKNTPSVDVSETNNNLSNKETPNENN